MSPWGRGVRGCGWGGHDEEGWECGGGRIRLWLVWGGGSGSRSAGGEGRDSLAMFRAFFRSVSCCSRGRDEGGGGGVSWTVGRRRLWWPREGVWGGRGAWWGRRWRVEAGWPGVCCVSTGGGGSGGVGGGRGVGGVRWARRHLWCTGGARQCRGWEGGGSGRVGWSAACALGAVGSSA